MAARVWPSAHLLVEPGEAEALFRGYVEASLAAASWAEVASDSRGPAGFLLGRIEDDDTFLLRCSAFWKRLKVMWNFIRGSYGRLKDPRGFVRALRTTDKKVRELCKNMNGEVVLFVVDPDYQGRGIGTALMDRFLDYARARGAKTVSLATDIDSNWRFYEIYGFKLFARFYDDNMAFLHGIPAASSIYRIDL
jgi:ribosomal protein S18 acetylase RimI-like enzyme